MKLAADLLSLIGCQAQINKVEMKATLIKVRWTHPHVFHIQFEGGSK